MTNDEIIQGLYRGDSRVIKEAIKVLEQESCEDCVSRQAVLDMATVIETDDYSGNEIMEVVDTDDIKKLPSVTPVACIATVKFSKEDMRKLVNEKMKDIVVERKKGHWIMTNDYLTAAYESIDYVKCSCCGEESLEEGNYCPNCGAEMQGVEE
jgi:hypothetical protein